MPRERRWARCLQHACSMSVAPDSTVSDDARGESWIDVSVAIRPGMVHYPGDPAITLRHEKHLERGDVATVSELALGVHTGTHVDAPVHSLLGTPGIDELALDDMIGPARVVDLPEIEVITAQD